MSRECEYSDVFLPKPECQTNEEPKILIWGDSCAMHLVDGIKASTHLGMMQATRTTCGPFLNISMFTANGFYNKEWAKKFINFNADVLDHLSRAQTIDTVVLSSLFRQYLAGNRILQSSMHVNTAERGRFFEDSGNEDLAASALSETINSIRKLGKKFVLVAPPPSASGVDFGRCFEMKESGKVYFGSDLPACEILHSRYLAESKAVRQLIKRVSQESNVDVIRLDEYLCHDGVCDIEIRRIPIYRDNSHLLVAGSRLLGRRMDLAIKLIAAAR